jgi:DNA-binding NarL/FixJ family response regulator
MMNSMTSPGGNSFVASDDHEQPTLLIADDDPVVRSTLSMQLAAHFEVIGVVEDANEAVRVASAAQPDLALLDVEMPGGGGIAAVTGIAAASPGTCMVILSGDEARGTVIELLAAGAMAYVRKGIPVSELTAKLGDALAASSGMAPPT